MNIWLGEGNLATVPEVREYNNGGKTVCKFLMAVSRHPGKREAGRDLIRIVAWDKQAINISRYLTKGSRVLVQGRVHSEFYQRDESSASRLNTEVYADSVTFLSPPPSTTHNRHGAGGFRARTVAMAGLRISRRSTSERHISPWGVTLIVVGVALLALGQNVNLTLLVGLLLVPPTVLVLIVVWRHLLPHRATKVLKDLGATSREGKGPKLRRLWRRGSVWYLAWKMPTGVTVSALTKRREAVEQALDASCEFWYDRGLFHMRAGVRKVPGLVKFEDFYRAPAPAGELVVGVGLSREGPLWADLTKVLHVLNGGQTDRGKSSWTRQALTWLALRYGPEHVRFALIDLKGGLELNVAERLPHMWRPVARELESCVETMRAVMAELERRQVLFDAARIENVQRWNEAGAGERLPYVVVVVDEIAELSAVESADRTAQALRQEALSAVSSLTRLGRATGFHVIVSTQRPDAKVVPGQIKANMPATVAFRVRANVNSEILLGEANYAAAALPPDVKGRAVWQWDRETEFQAVYLAKEEAETLLERAYPRVLTGVEAGTASVSPCPICPSVEEVLSS